MLGVCDEFDIPVRGKLDEFDVFGAEGWQVSDFHTGQIDAFAPPD